MKSTHKKLGKKELALVLFGGFASQFGAHAQSIGASEAVISQVDQDARHIVNLREVEISVLIDDVSSITGYTFIVHPSVRGKVSVSSQTPLTTPEVFQVFLSTLRVNGFAAVAAEGGAYKIVPENRVASEAAFAGRTGSGDQFETAVLTLDNFDAVEAARMIKPIINPEGQITATAVSNKLIVVDYAANIARVRQMLAQIDEDRSVIETIALNNVSAGEMAKMVNALTAGASRSFNADIGAIPMDSGNSLILRGDASDVARIAEIVNRLDNESRASEDSLKVIRINHGSAEDLAPILEGLAISMTEAATVGSVVTAPSVSTHTPTNSLIISAAPPVLRELERVVSELDVRRSQVLVEAIVVELSDNATRDLGLQFAVGGPDDTPIAVTNFSRTTPNILGLAGALITDNTTGDSDAPGGLANSALAQLAGVNGGLFGVGGQNADGNIFGVIVNAVQDDTNSSILSTPSVMALDNETAVFLSGQEIPITTGEALSANNNNPFRTVERQDVGVQLEVTPQISDEDAIRLAIRQEVSSISTATTGTLDIITNKREVTTTILADDGDIIVLGGLIQEEEELSTSKVPLLGDVPLLGRAFRSERKRGVRTNLMVFLRPTIVRDQEQVREVTDRKYTYIRDAQIDFSPSDTSSLEEIVDTVLGAGLRGRTEN